MIAKLLLWWPKPVSYPVLPSWKRLDLTNSPYLNVVLKQLAQGAELRAAQCPAERGVLSQLLEIAAGQVCALQSYPSHPGEGEEATAPLT